MANLCSNRLTLHVTKEGLDVFTSHLLNPDSDSIVVDKSDGSFGLFTKLLKDYLLVPNHLKDTGEHCYNWLVHELGSKWDLDDGDYAVEKLTEDLYQITICYDSAATPHIQAMEHLYNYAEWLHGYELAYHESGADFFGVSSDGCISDYEDFDDVMSENREKVDEIFGYGTYDNEFTSEEESEEQED